MIDDNDSLKTISQLAAQQRDLEKRIEDAEELLKALKTQHRAISEGHLPDAMAEAGVRTFTLDTGERVDVTSKLYISVPKSRMPQITAWLIENGYSPLVKDQIILQFDKGEHEQVEEAMRDLEASGWPYMRKEEVNSTSLKAVLNERLQKGEMDDLAFFGAHHVTRAIVETPNG